MRIYGRGMAKFSDTGHIYYLALLLLKYCSCVFVLHVCSWVFYVLLQYKFQLLFVIHKVKYGMAYSFQLHPALYTYQQWYYIIRVTFLHHIHLTAFIVSLRIAFVTKLDLVYETVLISSCVAVVLKRTLLLHDSSSVPPLIISVSEKSQW